MKKFNTNRTATHTLAAKRTSLFFNDILTPLKMQNGFHASGPIRPSNTLFNSYRYFNLTESNNVFIFWDGPNGNRTFKTRDALAFMLEQADLASNRSNYQEISHHMGAGMQKHGKIALSIKFPHLKECARMILEGNSEFNSSHDYINNCVNIAESTVGKFIWIQKFSQYEKIEINKLALELTDNQINQFEIDNNLLKPSR